jgi:pimeloyl-ACP methyl ester carboxylesterase
MKRSELWKWTKRGLALVASLLVLPVGLGAIYQAVASHLDARAAPPGLRVDIGGYRLHLDCRGHGNPTVVVSPGVGVWSVQWSKIQEALAQNTRVCTYDRDGYGWSDSGPSNTSAASAAKELHLLLEKAGESAPYVLVGESYGGYVARLFVANYRKDVAAAVLVESAHERQWDEIPEAKTLMLQGRQQVKVALWLSWIGIFRFWPMDRGEDLPSTVRPSLIATQARTQTFVAFGNELAGALTSAQQTAGVDSFGDLPLVVVSAGRSFDKFFSPEERYKTGPMNEKWMRLQNELARLSTSSVHLVSESATHGIAREQPEFVIAAISKALRMAVSRNESGVVGTPAHSRL